jgi:predicted Holliday junction resolvase-like endonuclease
MSELLGIFQSFRRILCVCPCCGEMMRLSDLHLKYFGRAPKTWLDTYDHKLLAFERKERLFEEKEKEMREKSIERGRKKVPQLIRKCLCPEFKRLKYDPYDIKAIMHPVDFIVFDGLNQGEGLKSITFLSRKAPNQEQGMILGSMRKTVSKKNYDWKVARITMDGKVSLE